MLTQPELNRQDIGFKSVAALQARNTPLHLAAASGLLECVEVSNGGFEMVM